VIFHPLFLEYEVILIELQEIKSWNRIDSDDDDNILLSLQRAAEAYLTNAGVAKDYSNELYKVCVQFIIQYWYENNENINTTSIGINSIIAQLR